MDGVGVDAPPTDHNGVGPSSGGRLAQLAMSAVGGGGGGAVMSSAPVPDVLLSLAKDHRYVAELSSLLSQVAVPFASILLPSGGYGGRSNNNRNRNTSTTPQRSGENYNTNEILEGDGQRFIERIRPELNLIASIIVHSATFIFYTRKFGASAVNDGDRIQRSLGMESLNLAYQYPAKMKTGSYLSTRDVEMKQINNIHQLLRGYLLRIASLWKINPWHRLMFLQTIIPYLIQRVGKGGWSNDLGGLLTTLMEQLGLRSTIPNSTRTIDDEQSREEEYLNDDRLRGLARRRLFDEQRRRMLSSSSTISQTEMNGDQDEQTADGTRNESNTSMSGHIQSSNLRSVEGTRFRRRLKRISTLAWNVTTRISLAMSSLSHGAHSLPRHHANVAPTESLDRYAKVIKWFLRLHLALFYWNGVYPTIAHRLAGAKLRDDVAPYSNGSSYSPATGAIVANRPSYKPIAAMILFQAAASLAQTTAELSVEAVHYLQVSYFRWQRRRRLQQQQQHINGRSNLNDEHNPQLDRRNIERAEYMELVEERVPGIESFNRNAISRTSNSRTKMQQQPGKDRSGSHPCGICLNERVHPAAPSVCGHVFCWNCILHWVSNVRAECPLCRAQTRPQDVIPLYNYF